MLDRNHARVMRVNEQSDGYDMWYVRITYRPELMSKRMTKPEAIRMCKHINSVLKGFPKQSSDVLSFLLKP